MSLIKTLWTSLALMLAFTAVTSTATLALMAFTSTVMAKNNNNQGNHGKTGGASAPEIDPGSMGSALALLGFGATMLLDRRRRK